uniref:Putative secreted protein n=1 Tax=Anopheles triannulatus TaxID=58253 RepID=A0A2M4B502_9DIPT
MLVCVWFSTIFPVSRGTVDAAALVTGAEPPRKSNCHRSPRLLVPTVLLGLLLLLVPCHPKPEARARARWERGLGKVPMAFAGVFRVFSLFPSLSLSRSVLFLISGW